MRLTHKQIEQMQVISAGNKDGSPVDIDEILERLSYKPSKESFQFSLRALIAKELVEKGAREVRRGRERQTIVLTKTGESMFPKPKPVSLLSVLTDPGIDF